MTEPELYYFLIREEDGSSRKVSYWSWGDTKAAKVLFCVHGMTRNGRDFDFLAEQLEKDFRVICPDIAGRGKSDRIVNKIMYNNLVYAGDMLKLIAYLKLPHIYWVGTSMGGLIGMLMAAYRPQLIKKMVINDVGPMIPKAALKRIAEYAGVDPIFADKKAAKEHFRKIYAPWGVKREEDLDHMVEYSLVPAKNGGFMLASDPGIGFNFLDKNGKIKELEDLDLWEFWEKIICPILVLRGADSDILPKEVAEKMMQTGPKAKLLEFPGIGHAPSLMEQDQVQPIIEWLKN